MSISRIAATSVCALTLGLHAVSANARNMHMETAPQHYGPSTLEIDINNVDVTKGDVFVEVFASEKSFNRRVPDFAQNFQANGTMVSVKFTNLEASHHAYRVYQDVDGNLKHTPGIDRTINQGRNDRDYSALDWTSARFRLIPGWILKTSKFPDNSQKAPKEIQKNETLIAGAHRTWSELVGS